MDQPQLAPLPPPSHLHDLVLGWGRRLACEKIPRLRSRQLNKTKAIHRHSRTRNSFPNFPCAGRLSHSGKAGFCPSNIPKTTWPLQFSCYSANSHYQLQREIKLAKLLHSLINSVSYPWWDGDGLVAQRNHRSAQQQSPSLGTLQCQDGSRQPVLYSVKSLASLLSSSAICEFPCKNKLGRKGCLTQQLSRGFKKKCIYGNKKICSRRSPKGRT